MDGRPIKKLLKYFYLKGGVDFSTTLSREGTTYNMHIETDIFEKIAIEFGYPDWITYYDENVENNSWYYSAEMRGYLTKNGEFTEKFINEVGEWDV